MKFLDDIIASKKEKIEVEIENGKHYVEQNSQSKNS